MKSDKTKVQSSLQLISNPKIASLIVLTFLFGSCEDFIRIDPPKNQLVRETVYSDDATAITAITGIYTAMLDTDGFASGGFNSITLLAGLSSDEIFDFYGSYPDFYLNSLTPLNSSVKSSLWELGYKYVYFANSVIEGLTASSNITQSLKKQLMAEAKFIRAFSYFYLTNLFGDVPIVTSTDYKVNSVATKSSKEAVFQFIIDELKAAKIDMPDDYLFASGQRVRPNKSAATALLARAFLYHGDWEEAEIEATIVIDNTAQYSLLTDLNEVFIKNSKEAIWQLMPIYPDYNTQEGAMFIMDGYVPLVSLSDNILTAFEDGDLRQINWIGSFDDGSDTWYYPYKYKLSYGYPLSEYSMILRLAEQYLIRAEARAHQDNLEGAKDDVNVIRIRAGLENTEAITQDEILFAIEHERQVELFTEWGHRWFDLIRTNRADEILGAVKAPNWESSDVLYPIPQVEIDNNANLKPQNPGYN